MEKIKLLEQFPPYISTNGFKLEVKVGNETYSIESKENVSIQFNGYVEIKNTNNYTVAKGILRGLSMEYGEMMLNHGQRYYGQVLLFRPHGEGIIHLNDSSNKVLSWQGTFY